MKSLNVKFGTAQEKYQNYTQTFILMKDIRNNLKN